MALTRGTARSGCARIVRHGHSAVVVLAAAFVGASTGITGATPPAVALLAAAALLLAASASAWRATASPVPAAVLDLAALGVLAAVLDPAIAPLLALAGLAPAVWLAAVAPPAALALSVAGGALLGGAPLLAGGALPIAAGEWTAAILPALLLPVAHLGSAWTVREERLGRDRELLAGRCSAAVPTATEAVDLHGAIGETVVGGFCLLSADGRLILANDDFRRTIARSGGDPRGHVPGPHVYEADRITPVPPAGDGRAARTGVRSGGLYWIGPRGDQQAVRVNFRVVHDADGAVTGTVVAFSDVTDGLEAAAARDAFLAQVSHELRTPLTSIVGYLEVIEDEAAERLPGLEPSFDAVRRNTEQLLGSVQDLIASSRPETALRLAPTDLAGLVDELVAGAQDEARRIGVTLTLAGTDRLEGELNRDKMTRVVQSLLSNALKFTPAGGQVGVELLREGDDAVLAVWDTGIGIDPDDQPRVFERFYRTDDARREAVRGMGLGLSVAKAIVEAHGGTITLSSARGAGSIFAVRVPLVAPASTSAEAAGTAGSAERRLEQRSRVAA